MLWHCTSKNFKVAIHGRTRLCQTTSIFPLHRHVRRPPIRHIKMAMSCRYAARTCARQLRFSSVRAPAQTLRVAATTRRYNSTEAEAATPPNPKIDEIVDQISKLTLLETADLVTSLKVRFIPFGQLSLREIAIADFSPSTEQSKLNIPAMPVGAFAAAPAAAAPAAAAEEAEEAAPAAAEKTLFTLKLQEFDAAAKAKVIKEVKNLLGLSLVESKKFVESAPKMMKENVPKEDAEKIIATMKELGAKVLME